MTAYASSPADRIFLPLSPTESTSVGISVQFDTERRYAGNPMARFFAELKRLGQLAPDWDGYGAAAPNRQALDRAHEMLYRLHDENLPPSDIGPSADGGVVISFFKDEKMAIFEFVNTGEVVYAFSTGPDQTTSEDLNPDPEDLDAAVAELSRQLNG